MINHNIIFSTPNGTMSIYLPNIYLFSKKNFRKVILLMYEDMLIWNDNKQHLMRHIKEEKETFENMQLRGVNKVSNISIDAILKRYDYYLFLLSTLN